METAPDDGSESQEKRLLSCYQCRERKVKCDRIYPCSECARQGQECQFPEGRKRPTNVKRPRVKELENRLRQLEHRFRSVSHIPPTVNTSLFQTGRVEQRPPQDFVDELTMLYFSKLHYEASMMDSTRYMASLYLPSHMQPPMCLQYTVLAAAASISPIHKQLALPFYQRARNYIQFDEMRGDGQDVMTLGHAQCWVLLGLFEAQNMWYSRAALSIGRSVRLAQMLGINNVEAANDHGMTIPPPRDWREKEERRRTMWTIFCGDRMCSSTTGWPVSMDARQIKTLLPVSEQSFQLGIDEPSVTLHQALHDEHTKYSPFACRVLSADLYYDCLQHTFGADNNADGDDITAGGAEEFWAQHHKLDNRLAAMFIALPDGLRCPDNIHSRDAVFINLQLHTAVICVQRAGLAKLRNGPPEGRLPASAAARMLASAHEIFALMAIFCDLDTLFHNPFSAFATFMAAFAFLEDYAASQDGQSEERLGALLNLMIMMASQNPMTASLTVQLAQELARTGIDKSALEKVAGIGSQINPQAPLAGQHNDATGAILLCPLKASSGRMA